jgi:hypothetical protein
MYACIYVYLVCFFFLHVCLGRETLGQDQVWDFSPGPAEPAPLSEGAAERVRRALEARDLRRSDAAAAGATEVLRLDTPEQFFAYLAKPRRKAPPRTRVGRNAARFYG